VPAAPDPSAGPGAPPAEAAERERLVRWSDPVATFEGARELSGLEYMQAIVEGRMAPPPVRALVGHRAVEVEEGRIVFEAEPGEFQYNPVGTVQGGVAAVMLDSAMGSAVHTLVPAGGRFATLEFKVNLVRAMRAGMGTVRIEGRVLHPGGRIATAEGHITDAEGRLYAHGVTTCMVERPAA